MEYETFLQKFWPSAGLIFNWKFYPPIKRENFMTSNHRHVGCPSRGKRLECWRSVLRFAFGWVYLEKKPQRYLIWPYYWGIRIKSSSLRKRFLGQTFWKWNSWEGKLSNKHLGGRERDDEFKERNLGEKFWEWNSREWKYETKKLRRHWREKRERETGQQN